MSARRAEDRKPAGNFNLPLMKDRFRNAAVTSDTPALYFSVSWILILWWLKVTTALFHWGSKVKDTMHIFLLN